MVGTTVVYLSGWYEGCLVGLMYCRSFDASFMVWWFTFGWLEGLMDGWCLNSWFDASFDVLIGGWMIGLMFGCMDAWIYGWSDGLKTIRMAGCLND